MPAPVISPSSSSPHTPPPLFCCQDLTHLGRKLENTIIVDNSPFSYMFQPENAIPITSWFNDKSDRQLYDLLPHLDHMADCSDVIAMLAQKKLQFVNGQVLLGS